MAKATELEQEIKFRIPAVIKWNTLFFALSQAFVGAGTQMNPALGALVVLRLTGSAALAGLGTSTMGISRFLVSYPAGKISDRFGRKPVLMLGLVLGGVGAALVGLSVVRGDFPLMVVAFLVFGLGMGAAQQIRVAAADMYPPRRRGLGMGYVLTGSLLGVLMAPVIVIVAQRISPQVHIDSLALPWLFVPAVIVPAIFLVLLVRPDPKEIAINLEKYYPGYKTPPRAAMGSHSKVNIMTFLRHYPKRVAFVSSFAVQGNMSMMMFMTSLVLHEHGHDLSAISLSVAIHVMGMFGFSMPLGWLADKVGRRTVMLAGVLTAGAGSIIVPSSHLYWVITAGTFLVGVGWSCVYVAAATLIADTSAPEERGRAVGSNDTISYSSGIVLPLVAGPMAQAIGFGWVGLLGMCLMVPPFLLLMKLREPSPGKYVWGARSDEKT